MAWNEPGDKNPRDPWGGGGKNDGPPDLDEIFKKLNDRVNKIFGGKGSSGGGGPAFSPAMLGIGIILLAIVWAGAGVYQVDTTQQVIILRLGKFHSTVGEGLHWNPPFVDKRIPVDFTTERQYSSEGLMLTEDENIVEVPLKVQYRVEDAKAFALNVRNPEESLRHATDSALRHVVGSTSLNSVLSEGRTRIAAEVQERLQRYLDNYGTGIRIREVNIQEGKPPAAVKNAFDDVIAAKEDKDRLINEAEAYSNEIIPVARGRAQRLLEEANAYRAEVVAQATGEASRFEQVLTEYQKAPEVTRQRMYLDAVESVFSNSSKVMVDVDGGNNMMYLPLDKINSSGSLLSSPSSQNGPVEIELNRQQMRELGDRLINELRREQSSSRRRELR